MTIYEMADKYYNGVPRMWDKARLEALVKAGKLTKKEYEELISKNK